MTHLEKRRRRLQITQRATFARWFSATGREMQPVTDRRVAWQAALVLLGSPKHQRLGNAILRHVSTEPCHFCPAYAASILVRFSSRLDKTVRGRVAHYLQSSLPGATTRDIRFHGFNDNFPALATATLALAGRIFDSSDAREAAKRNLQDVHSLLRRRTWLSEFNSPTYTPISLAAFAEAAEFADTEELRTLARQAEQRVWDDIAAHWHGPTVQPAGPYSRAYECDRVAQFTSLHVPVWLVSGRDCPLDPIKSLFPPPGAQVIHHTDDLRFVQGFTAALGAAPYHPAPGLNTRLWEKRFPVSVAGDCEAGTSGPTPVDGRPRVLYGCTNNYTTTWLSAGSSLGTSRRPFLDGNQSCAFYATWRKRNRVHGLGDLRSCFAGYAVDDFSPGQANRTVLFPQGLDRDQVYDHGRCVTLQYQGTALVLYRPKLELAGRPLKRLALQISLPLHAGKAPAVYFGSKLLAAGRGQSAQAESVTVREGGTVLHFRPLLLGELTRCRATTLVEIRNRYLVISWLNFEDWNPRAFSELELAACGNGFLCQLREAAPSMPLKRLLPELTSGSVTDEFYADRRRVGFTGADVSLTLDWCPFTETIQSATINGENAPV